jgi:hypothetical protein
VAVASCRASGVASNFRLPYTPATLAPSDTSRCASASVCAHTAVSAEYAGRASQARRSAAASDFSFSRALASTRNTPLGAGRGHHGPDLGFHQHADARLKLVQEAPHGARRVPRLPHLRVAGFEQLGALLAAGGRAVREQDRHARVLAPQLGDQDGGRARLAERHGMHPALRLAGDGGVVVAEALLHGHAVARLGLRAAPQLAADQGLHNGGEDAVEAKQQGTHGARFQWDAAASLASGLAVLSSASISPRCGAALRCVWPSKRSTSTGVVFDARTRPKPSGQSTRRPSMVETFAFGEARLLHQFVDHAVRLALFALHVQLRRREAGGQRVEHGARVRVRDRISSRRQPGVGAVVEAEPALLEEDVAAHLAAQRRIHFLHLRLDQRVAGLVHHRLAAGGLRWRAPGAACT